MVWGERTPRSDRLSRISIECPTIQPPHDFSEDEPTARMVIAGLLARLPARLDACGADRREDLLPRFRRPRAGRAARAAKAGGVCQEMPNGDSLFPARREF